MPQIVALRAWRTTELPAYCGVALVIAQELSTASPTGAPSPQAQALTKSNPGGSLWESRFFEPRRGFLSNRSRWLRVTALSFRIAQVDVSVRGVGPVVGWIVSRHADNTVRKSRRYPSKEFRRIARFKRRSTKKEAARRRAS